MSGNAHVQLLLEINHVGLLLLKDDVHGCEELLLLTKLYAIHQVLRNLGYEDQ